MARIWASAIVFKAVFTVCFLALFLQMLAFAEWALVSNFDWHSPTAHLSRYFALLLAGQAVALVFYFRRPWVSVVVGWLSVAVLLARAIPWSTPGWRIALRQFRFELVFLALTHLGWVAFVKGKRAEAQEIAEITGISENSSNSTTAHS